MSCNGMLKTAELDMKKGNTRGSHVLVVQVSGKKIGKRKKHNFGKNSKGKSKFEGKAKAPAQAGESSRKKDFSNVKCFHCGGKGHLKRNFCKYLADLKAGISPSGYFVVEFYLASNSDWVHDTGSCAHIC